jgi:hypothetical protein
MLRMLMKATPISPGVLREIPQYFAQKQGHVTIPLEITCSGFKEVTDNKSDKEESTRKTTDFGNCVCKVIQLELQRRALRVTGKS